MIFIGGVSPKTIVISQKPELCPICGLAQAYYQRVDHYVNLFFIPIFRIKKGEPFLMCRRCERTVHEMEEDYTEILHDQNNKCKSCGRSLQAGFTYCPYCGKEI